MSRPSEIHEQIEKVMENDMLIINRKEFRMTM